MSSKSTNPNSDSKYLAWLTEWASKHSDGCTGVSEIHEHCCWQHDHAYQTGFEARSVFENAPVVISRKEADQQFRDCNMDEDILGRFSPIAWFRYAGVRLFGRFFYKR